MPGPTCHCLIEVMEAGCHFEIGGDDAANDCGTIEAEMKYRGYLKRHARQLDRTQSQEARGIPAEFEYTGIPGLSREVIERLTEVRPATIGQAARVPGVTPAAVAIVAARVDRWRDRPREARRP